MKGFKVVIYISFPLPKLCLAQSMQPRKFELAANCGRWEKHVRTPQQVGASPWVKIVVPVRSERGKRTSDAVLDIEVRAGSRAKRETRPTPSS